MLTQGNHKLGKRLIWSFSLPSAHPDICVSMTDLCQRHCYSHRLEQIRPTMDNRYEANYRRSLLPSFAGRIRNFLSSRRIRVVRLHVGGEFYSPEYANKWLLVMRRLPRVRFFFYTRTWRDESIRPVLEEMASLSNCRVWYSLDRETGIPEVIPPSVRLAWMATAHDDMPPTSAHLVFRIRRLRSQPATHMNNVRVCPAEDGIERTRRVTCERCRLCWQPLPEAEQGFSLPLVPPEEGR